MTPSSAPAGSASPHRLAPDLARLPINRNLRAISIAEGVRAALSVAAIIALNEQLAWPPLREAALGALLTCLCDPGGPIQRRAPILLGFAGLGALTICLLGPLRGFGWPVALPIGGLALFAASFARIYGQPQQQLGALLAVVIVLSLDLPLPLSQSVLRGAAFFGGALWAIVLTLLIWRLHPYRPARQAIADVYRALADLAADVLRLLPGPAADGSAWDRHARAHRRVARDAIEAARGTLLDTLRGRGSSSPRAGQSLIRLETAEQLFGALIALSDALQHADAAEQRAALPALRRLRAILTVLAQTIAADKPGHQARLLRSIDRLAQSLAAASPLRPILAEIAERLRVAHTLAVPQTFQPGGDPAGARPSWRLLLWPPLRANLTWRSVSLRHAARAAVAGVPALAITMAWFTPYDHWLTITIVLTLQPFFALTYTRAIERVVGTACGGVVAAVVGMLCQTPLAVAVAMFPLAVLALSIRAVNFGLFMMGLTPVVVLLIEAVAPGTSSWQIAVARAALTTIGGLVAVAASFVLWPDREAERTADELRLAIAAHGAYADAVLGYVLRAEPAETVQASRRGAGLASNALEASLNRALIEAGKGQHDRLSAALVIDAALRRCAGRLTAMLFQPEPLRALSAAELASWRDWLRRAFEALAAGQAGIELRPQGPAADALLRLARQVELMGAAMLRLG